MAIKWQPVLQLASGLLSGRLLKNLLLNLLRPEETCSSVPGEAGQWLLFETARAGCLFVHNGATGGLVSCSYGKKTAEQ